MVSSLHSSAYGIAGMARRSGKTKCFAHLGVEKFIVLFQIRFMRTKIQNCYIVESPFVCLDSVKAKKSDEWSYFTTNRFPDVNDFLISS